jgi:hypothetical protein
LPYSHGTYKGVVDDGVRGLLLISMEEWRVGTAVISGTLHSASAALRESI